MLRIKPHYEKRELLSFITNAVESLWLYGQCICKKRPKCAALLSTLFALSYKYFVPSETRSVVVLTRLLFLLFLLLLLALLAVALLSLELLLPHLVRHVLVEIWEDNVEDFLVPLDGAAFYALFDVLSCVSRHSRLH